MSSFLTSSANPVVKTLLPVVVCPYCCHRLGFCCCLAPLTSTSSLLGLELRLPRRLGSPGHHQGDGGLLRRLSPPFLRALLLLLPVTDARRRIKQLAGSLGFLSSIALSLYLPASRHPRGISAGLRSLGPRGLLLSAMTTLWAGRLGMFLAKVRRRGKPAARRLH